VLDEIILYIYILNPGYSSDFVYPPRRKYVLSSVDSVGGSEFKIINDNYAKWYEYSDVQWKSVSWFGMC
jgi:hypothetical protein